LHFPIVGAGNTIQLAHTAIGYEFRINEHLKELEIFCAERAAYIARVRALTKMRCESWVAGEAAKGFSSQSDELT